MNMRSSWEEGDKREKKRRGGERTEILPSRRPAIGHEKGEMATREIDAGTESKNWVLNRVSEA